MGKKSTRRACELYLDEMKLKLRHFVLVRETGLEMQPSLFWFWLAISPDGLVAYQTSDKKLSLSSIDLVQDPNFYVNLENGEPILKKSHSTGYYSQIQLAMGLSGFETCDFVVYTFKGLVIVRTEFDVSYFDSLIQKLNLFHKKFMLP